MRGSVKPLSCELCRQQAGRQHWGVYGAVSTNPSESWVQLDNCWRLIDGAVTWPGHKTPNDYLPNINNPLKTRETRERLNSHLHQWFGDALGLGKVHELAEIVVQVLEDKIEFHIAVDDV